jgi:hypothetical protein
VQPTDDELDIEAMPLALQPTGRFVAYWRQTLDVLELSCRALTEHEDTVRFGLQIQTLADHINAGEAVPEVDDTDYTSQLPRTVGIAKREVASDFPLLHAHALVGLWGAFEAWTEDTLEAWLVAGQDVIDWSQLAQRIGTDTVPVPLSSAASLNLPAVARSVRILIQQSNRGAAGLAVAQGVFKPLNLNVQVDDEMRRNIHQFEAIRHVYAHRAGIADDTFVSSCPDIDAAVGERVLVGHQQFGRYAASLRDYVLRVANRIGELYPTRDA